MDTINHKLTVGYLKQIFLSTRRSGLDSDSNTKELDSAYQYLSAMFNLTHIQCTLFSIIFNFSNDEDLEQITTQRLMSYFNLELEHFFDIKPDVELLINRGFIKQKKEDRTDNLFNSYFKVNQKLLDMIFQNQVIDFEKLYGNGYNFVQFTGFMFRVNNRKLISHQSRKDVLNEIIEQENKNENLTQIQTMKSLGLQVKDRLIMYYLIHKYKDDNENSVSAYTVGFDVLGPSKILSFTKKLREKTTLLQVQGLVELINDSDLQLTNKTKKLLLNDTTNTVEESQSEVATTHYYIKHESIPDKQLYFNSDIQRELNILQTLLQKDNFIDYQREMKMRGNKAEGISFLIYGPSGTGKSSIVDQLAKQTKRNIFQVDLSQVRSKWWGESEKNIKQIFEEYKAKCSKSDSIPILLFNECDALLGKRNISSDEEDRHDFTQITMTNLLLELFEANKAIIIAITNLPEALDKAFLRRFTMKYFIGNPDKRVVKSILKNKIDFLEEKEVERIANQFQLTGGQIENISSKCIINRIITKSNPTVSEVMVMCEEEKIKSNPWKKEY